MLSGGTEEEGGVVAAEAEAVAHGGANGRAAGLVGRVVQVALGIGVLVVDDGWDDASLDRLDGDDGVDAAGGAQAVADHALGGADGEAVGVLAKGALDGGGLGAVVVAGAGAVGVEVVQLAGLQGGLGEGLGHAADGALAVVGWGGEGVGVGGGAVPGE